eukprot:m.257947 g.257947  ORF g.257947 m.257947 type:complete len:80 (-) comp35923_c0_seq1:419-658(-)
MDATISNVSKTMSWLVKRTKNLQAGWNDVNPNEANPKPKSLTLTLTLNATPCLPTVSLRGVSNLSIHYSTHTNYTSPSL